MATARDVQRARAQSESLGDKRHSHLKACLVVRREPDGIRRSCHLVTGNYNARTSGIYSDLGFFTCRDAIGEDIPILFNFLTGYSIP